MVTPKHELAKIGRPLRFPDVEALEHAIETYFAVHKETGELVTMSGLAVHLGVDRKTLVNYTLKDDFLPTIARARAKVEAAHERYAFDKDKARGAIFSLQNNFGWSEKQDRHMSGSVGIERIERVIVKPERVE